MTKKEFINLIKDVPDDFDIVFWTNKNLIECAQLKERDIFVISQCVNEEELKFMSLSQKAVFKPQYKAAIVIDAIPYWYLEERFNITIQK